MKILPGRSHPNLARRLSEITNIEIAKTNIENFADGELRIQILDNVTGEEIIVLQSTSPPVNDNLMELLLLVDAAKRAGAKKIISIIPYFGYGRQDRLVYKGSPISAELVANLLQAAGVNEVITVDLHSKLLADFFKISIQNLSPVNLFLPFLKNLEGSIIISPDSGGSERAKKFSSLLNIDVAIINKKRLQTSECIMNDMIGNVKGKHCVIIDDIVDTSKTLSRASELLISKGALSVNACVTHAILSPPAIDLLEKSNIAQIFITDSIELKALPPKFRIISVENLIAGSIILSI